MILMVPCYKKDEREEEEDVGGLDGWKSIFTVK